MLSKLFTATDTWNGGFYELAIELGPRSDERLRTALEMIWQYDGLDGCYEDSRAEPSNQPRLMPSLEIRQLGIATLPNGRQLACGSFTVREDNGTDWIGFYLPMGALASVYDVGAYPFGDETSRTWREPLDDWLTQIAGVVFAAVPFSLALVGHEVSGMAYAEEIRNTGMLAERWVGYLWREGERLVWYPPTRYEPSFTE
jgi:hypothetical protein